MIGEDIRPLMVTIRCIAYNHEPYIRKCLESIVTQETNFRFEAIVHDDASTDGTANIIREFEEKYPNIIKPIYEEENQYKKCTIRGILDAHTHGKYVTSCECDDFWTDPLKLQKQVDFLESHLDYVAVAGNYIGVDSNGNNPKVHLMRWETNKSYALKDFLCYGMIIHGNGLLYRNVLPKGGEKFERLVKTIPTMGDVINRVLLYDKGDIYVFREVMLAHRDGSKDKSSYTYAQINQSIEYSYMYGRLVDALEKYFDGKYDLSKLKANRTGLILFDILRGHSHVKLKELFEYLSSLPWKIHVLSYERCIQKIIRGIVKKAGRLFHLY